MGQADRLTDVRPPLLDEYVDCGSGSKAGTGHPHAYALTHYARVEQDQRTCCGARTTGRRHNRRRRGGRGCGGPRGAIARVHGPVARSLAENPEHHRDGNDPREPDPQQLPAAHAALLRWLCGRSFSSGWSPVLRHRPSRLEGDKRYPTVRTEGSIRRQEARTLRAGQISKLLLFGKYSLLRPRHLDRPVSALRYGSRRSDDLLSDYGLVHHLLFGCRQVDDHIICCRLVRFLLLCPGILRRVHTISILSHPVTHF